MKSLLDTSVWLRGATEPETVPPDLQRILNAPGETFALSAISLWEVGKKHQIGKLTLRKDLLIWLREAVSAHIELLPLTPEIIADAMRLPDFPNRDPADEIIVATARVHHLTLLTTDTVLKGYRHAKISYFTPVLEERKK
ncbi:MAG: type II toxin-antitoxin system VapC family toxin [Verrucomicrobiota bacterium]